MPFSAPPFNPADYNGPIAASTITGTVLTITGTAAQINLNYGGDGTKAGLLKIDSDGEFIIQGTTTNGFVAIRSFNGNGLAIFSTFIQTGLPLTLKDYTVSTLPDPTAFGLEGSTIYVKDGTLNKRFAISDGVVYRWPDGLAVS